MPTQPFLSNEADAFDDIQAAPESQDFEYLLLGHQRTGILSGCVVTESSPTAQTVDIALGEVMIGGEQVTVAVQLDEAVSSADGSNPRKDLISIDSTGSVVITAGTPAAVPAAPAVPADSVPLAILLVPTSDNDHEDAQISDKRIFPLGYTNQRNVKDWGAIGDGVADDTAAIQACIGVRDVGFNLSGGTEIYFPPGNYLLNAALTIAVTEDTDARIHFRGAVGRRGVRIIQNSNTSRIFEFTTTAGNLRGVSISDIALYKGATAIYLEKCVYHTYNNVSFMQQLEYSIDNGIALTATDIAFNNCWWVLCRTERHCCNGSGPHRDRHNGRCIW